MLVTNVVHQSPPKSPTATIARRAKRKTDDDLGSEQRLAKRFHLLSLGIPKHQITAEDIQRVQRTLEKNGEFVDELRPPELPRLRRSRSNAFSDTMNVDDSRDRIFIHNLEDELADLSSDEEHPIFIPEIERKLNMLPKVLLRPDNPQRLGNELVLYEVPSSLTIPIEQDSTRKAIIESRRRAQEQFFASKSEVSGKEPLDLSVSSLGGPHSGHDHDHDEDAMDMS